MLTRFLCFSTCAYVVSAYQPRCHCPSIKPRASRACLYANPTLLLPLIALGQITQSVAHHAR